MAQHNSGHSAIQLASIDQGENGLRFSAERQSPPVKWGEFAWFGGQDVIRPLPSSVVSVQAQAKLNRPALTSAREQGFARVYGARVRLRSQAQET